MGMFDTYKVNEECPHCKSKITEIQSKELSCTLEEYSAGDTLKTYNLHIDKGSFIEDSYCNCKDSRLRQWTIYINDNKFSHVEKFNEEGEDYGNK